MLYTERDHTEFDTTRANTYDARRVGVHCSVDCLWTRGLAGKMVGRFKQVLSSMQGKLDWILF